MPPPIQVNGGQVWDSSGTLEQYADFYFHSLISGGLPSHSSAVIIIEIITECGWKGTAWDESGPSVSNLIKRIDITMWPSVL